MFANLNKLLLGLMLKNIDKVYAVAILKRVTGLFSKKNYDSFWLKLTETPMARNYQLDLINH